MKQAVRVLLLAAFAVAMAATSYGAAFCNPASGGIMVCPIDATSTYLTAAGPLSGGVFGPDGTAPLIIDLQSVGLGLTTGSVVTFTASGSLNINNGGTNTIVVPSFGAVFSSTNALLANVASNRVTGALAAPGGTTSAGASGYVGGVTTTTNGGFQTDISQDFLIFQSGTTITLPNISTYRYLFVGILDNLYADNVTVTPLQLTVSVVPEPATYGLLLSGLGALVAFRRYRKN
jgi:hypothetical protein